MYVRALNCFRCYELRGQVLGFFLGGGERAEHPAQRGEWGDASSFPKLFSRLLSIKFLNTLVYHGLCVLASFD